MRFSDRSRSRAQIRDDLKLPVDRPIILVMGGGLGLGSFKTTTRALDQLVGDFTVVVMVGRIIYGSAVASGEPPRRFATIRESSASSTMSLIICSREMCF